MKNLSNIMKQAGEMQAKMAEMQAKMESYEITGSAGAGMVEITLNGKMEVKKLKIDKNLMVPDDVEILEDLLLAAFNDAKHKINAYTQEETSKLTSGLGLPPGLKLPF